VLVKVTVLAALVVFLSTRPKLSDAGDKVAPGPFPVPVRATVCGLPEALSATASEAVRVPAAVGLKDTLMVQLPPAASVAPHVCVWEKSVPLVPVNEYPEMVKEAAPVLVRVTVWAALVVFSA
jgi:hypothetical protein